MKKLNLKEELKFQKVDPKDIANYEYAYMEITDIISRVVRDSIPGLLLVDVHESTDDATRLYVGHQYRGKNAHRYTDMKFSFPKPQYGYSSNEERAYMYTGYNVRVWKMQMNDGTVRYELYGNFAGHSFRKHCRGLEIIYFLGERRMSCAENELRQMCEFMCEQSLKYKNETECTDETFITKMIKNFNKRLIFKN